MAHNSLEGEAKGWLVKEFSTQAEADAYMADLYNQLLKQVNEQLLDDSVRAESESEELKTSSANRPITRTRTVNNTRGTSRKNGIGVTMRQPNDSKWYVYVKLDETLEAGNMWEDDISHMNVQCVEYYWYYNWWNGRSWVHVTNAGRKVAESGKYFTRVGISWIPKE